MLERLYKKEKKKQYRAGNGLARSFEYIETSSFHTKILSKSIVSLELNSLKYIIIFFNYNIRVT